MKKLCKYLQDTPWLIWAAIAIGLLVFTLGTPRLPGGNELERLVNGCKLAALLFGVFAIRQGVSKENGRTPWLLAGLLLLVLFAAITLAAWFYRA